MVTRQIEPAGFGALRLRVWGTGFRAEGLGWTCQGLESGYRVWDFAVCGHSGCPCALHVLVLKLACISVEAPCQNFMQPEAEEPSFPLQSHGTVHCTQSPTESQKRAASLY